MNLILLHPEDCREDNHHVRLSDRRFVHIRTVLRATPGQRLHVGWMGGQMGAAEVTHIDDSYVDLTLGELTQAPPPPLPLHLILALPRPKSLRRILQTATSMGVKRFTLVNTYKVEKNFWSSDLLNKANIHLALKLGLEQAKDTSLPRVDFQRRFKPYVEDELPALVKNSLALVAHPGSYQPCPYQLQTHTTLFVGPEGGLIDYEVEKLSQVGFQAIHLGPRVLKVEPALTALISRFI